MLTIIDGPLLRCMWVIMEHLSSTLGQTLDKHTLTPEVTIFKNYNNFRMCTSWKHTFKNDKNIKTLGHKITRELSLILYHVLIARLCEDIK